MVRAGASRLTADDPEERPASMALDITTQDSSAVTDEQLDEMALIGGAFGREHLEKARADWVLCTSARADGKLHGVMFATLERIGGTPCVLIGLLTVKRSGKRDTVLKGLMTEAYHRALMAFPDEDVVVGSRFARADGMEAFKSLADIIPRTGHRADGEQRAWGRRLARRFGVDARYDEKTFIVASDGRGGFLDHESSKPERTPAAITALFEGVNDAKGGSLVVHGWTTVESLLKLGAKA
jgi:hypothetical protein